MKLHDTRVCKTVRQKECFQNIYSVILRLCTMDEPHFV